MSTLLLIRHGESEWNRKGRIQGQADSPLTGLGIAQARMISAYLAGELRNQRFRIYSSPLSRARQTATIIAQALGYEPEAIIIDQRLNDFDQGVITGIYGWDTVAREYPELARLRLQDPIAYHPPGGESGADFRHRLAGFLTDLDTDHTIHLIVSHGIVNKYLRSIRRHINGAAMIALGESQYTIYRLDDEQETEINTQTRSDDPSAPGLAARVRVSLDTRSYDVVIAAQLISRSASYLAALIDRRRVALVSDEFVLKTYLPQFAPVLDSLTSRWSAYCIEGGESAKSFSGLERLLNAMLADGIDRHCIVIAFGGGVVGDVAGFAAALLMRGIELIQIPTTLLAQVDSAVGGKNAINTRYGKNLVGSFLQPRIVLNDVSVLASLPAAELKAGYGEIIKYGLLRGEAEFSRLEQNVDALMRCDEAALIEVIRMGCTTKADIVSKDERDHAQRAWVNLGHTFAHAFEAQTGFGAILHGAAVAVGLIAACDLSERMGVCAPGLSDRVRRHTRHAGLPVTLNELSPTSDWTATAIRQSMLHDKKTVAGQLNFVLLRAIGKPFVSAAVPTRQLDQTLHAIGAD